MLLETGFAEFNGLRRAEAMFAVGTENLLAKYSSNSALQTKAQRSLQSDVAAIFSIMSLLRVERCDCSD